ncbi:hypothetical protein KAS50_05510 [bacterium]|nr:hypothetical protein [bacterium]
MVPLLLVPVFIWGGVALIGVVGKYVQKNFVFICWSQKLTRRTLDHLATIGSGRLDCCICLELFCEEETVVNLRCSHLFHKKCFADYMDHAFKTCPVCRAPF